MKGFTLFERAIMKMLLAGDHPTLATLRAQAAVCRVTRREHTGVGSMTDISVPPEVPLVTPPSITLGDVNVFVHGIEHSSTTLLAIRDGRLSFLEFATWDNDWPLKPALKSISYLREERIPQGYKLEPCEQRDAETLARALCSPAGRIRRAAP